MPASVTINVTSFVPSTATNPVGLLPTAFCGITQPVTVSDPSGQVSLDPDDSRFLLVKNDGRVDITFTIASETADCYTPRTVLFNRTAGSVNGSDFEVAPPVGSTIRVTDTLADKGKKADGTMPKWEYYIQIAKPDGVTLGWIDPGIENSDAQ